MILVVDMNFRRDSLGYYEFVLPILYAIGNLGPVAVKHYLDVSPEDVNGADCIIMSGTPLKDNVALNQPERFSWLKECPKPVLGICAGMQTIALVFDAKLEKCLSVGLSRIETAKSNPLFSSTFNAYALHNYSLATLGHFEVLAKSEKCVEAIKLAGRDIFGVLFHPEVRNGEIIQRFVRAFGSTE
jgi:GMP synthase (glutamine-hydrolysing)